MCEYASIWCLCAEQRKRETVVGRGAKVAGTSGAKMWPPKWITLGQLAPLSRPTTVCGHSAPAHTRRPRVIYEPIYLGAVHCLGPAAHSLSPIAIPLEWPPDRLGPAPNIAANTGPNTGPKHCPKQQQQRPLTVHLRVVHFCIGLAKCSFAAGRLLAKCSLTARQRRAALSREVSGVLALDGRQIGWNSGQILGKFCPNSTPANSARRRPKGNHRAGSLFWPHANWPP